MRDVTDGATDEGRPDAVEFLDMLRDLLREMQRTDFRVAVNREEAAAMFGLKPTSDMFGKNIEPHLRKRQPGGYGGKLIYSVQSIREYMGDVNPEGDKRVKRGRR